MNATRKTGRRSARDRLLDAFPDVMMSSDDVTLASLAKRAKTSSATARRTFPSMESAASSWLNRESDRAARGAEENLDPSCGRRDRLFELMMRGFEAMESHRDVLFRMSRHSETRRALLASWVRSERGLASMCGFRVSRPSDALRLAGLGAIQLRAAAIWATGNSETRMTSLMTSLEEDLRRGERTMRRASSLAESACDAARVVGDVLGCRR